MTATDGWRAAVAQTTRLYMVTRALAVLAAILSVVLIGMGAGLAGWVGIVTGVIGLGAAALVWWGL